MHSVAIWIRLLAEVRDIYLLQSIQTGCGAHPGPLSLWVKQLGYEADHSPAPSTEVKEVELDLLSLKCLHGTGIILLLTLTYSITIISMCFV